MKKRRLLRAMGRFQLDASLRKEKNEWLRSPAKGWIATVREALGMRSSQLSRRLGMTKQGIWNIEKAEREGRLTLSTLKKAAEALHCDVKVTLVPKKTLREIVREQALKMARQIVERSNLHMQLEAQGTDVAFRKREIERLAEEMVSTDDPRLWEG